MIDEPGEIMGTIVESATSMGGVSFDGENLPGPEGTGADCYLGTMFEGDGSGYFVGILTEIRFFMDYFSDKAVYSGNLKFQGSNTGFDDDSAVDILTIDEELHEGWNYYKFEEWGIDTPKYRYYRLFNAVNNGCDKIGEINFIGAKAFDSTDENHFCSVTVSGEDFTEQLLTDLGGAQVEYVIA